MMPRFFARKLLRVIAVLVGAALITFLLMHAIPGNPWSNYSSAARALPSSNLDRMLQEQLDRHYGLDLPLWRQFIRYIIGDIDRERGLVCGVICGNLGPSISQRGRAVTDVFFGTPSDMTFWKSRFGYSIRLVLLAALFAVGLGIPLGMISAAHPHSAPSRAISIGLAALVSIPNFVLGLLAIVILASGFKLIPVLPDWNVPAHWITPAIVLGIMPMASIARFTRATLVNLMSEDFVRTAHGKGLSPARVLRVHVLRNALVAIIVFLGPTLVEMFTGLLVVENLYAFPGLGREFWEAVLKLDYPLIMGLTLLYAAGIMLVNTLAEILSEVLDPRLRTIEQRGVS